MTLGIARNPYAMNVSNALMAAAGRLSIPVRAIDLPTLRARLGNDRTDPKVTDRHGVVEVDALAPYLVFGHPAAVHGLRALSRRARTQNLVDPVLLADDKAACADRLFRHGVPQVDTVVCAMDPGQAREVAAEIGYPVVLKRTHGAQGRWVRRVDRAESLDIVLSSLAAEGAGALIVQPQVVESFGHAIRVVLTGGQLIAATERVAASGEWKSNVAAGAMQARVSLTSLEHRMVVDAVAAVGLGHAGVDILRTSRGSLVLEVNACPDFTSMQSHVDTDLAALVVEASLGAEWEAAPDDTDARA